MLCRSSLLCLCHSAPAGPGALTVQCNVQVPGLPAARLCATQQGGLLHPGRALNPLPDLGCCVCLPAPCSRGLTAAPAAAPSSGGWLGGWFSGGKKEEEAKPAAPTDLSEDRFAPPPMPTFGGSPEPQFR